MERHVLETWQQVSSWAGNWSAGSEDICNEMDVDMDQCEGDEDAQGWKKNRKQGLIGDGSFPFEASWRLHTCVTTDPMQTIDIVAETRQKIRSSTVCDNKITYVMIFCFEVDCIFQNKIVALKYLSSSQLHLGMLEAFLPETMWLLWPPHFQQNGRREEKTRAEEEKQHVYHGRSTQKVLYGRADRMWTTGFPCLSMYKNM